MYRSQAENGERERLLADEEIKSLPPRYSREFLRFHLKAAYDDFWAAYSFTANLNNSRASLEELDTSLPQSIEDELNSLGRNVDIATLWTLHAGLGSYFGEVLVKELNGRWRYPSRFLTMVAWLLHRPDVLYRHWYVVVGAQRVPVFEIARRRETLGREKASLVDAYKRIAGSMRERRRLL
jgi:hypothetical protein